QEYIVQSVVHKGMTDMRLENYTVALRLPMTYFTQHGTSDTMSRFVQDTGEVARGHVLLFGKTLVEPAKAISTLLLALWMSWELTLVCLLAGPPVYLMLRKLGKGMRKASKRALQNWSKLLAVLTETLIGMRVVKAYTMETKERKRFFRTNQELFRQQQKMAAIDSAIGPVIESVGMVAAVAAVCIAGYLVLKGDMDPAMFISWLVVLMATFDPIRHLAKVATQFQRTEAAATRVFELQDRVQEDRVVGGPDLPRHSKTIEFRHVSFRYPGGTEALKDVSLTIQAGEVVAVVGPNGSGKTTLVQMIPRLIDPAAGEVLIDGHDLRKVSMRSLRRQVGIVTQDTVLFNATIGENIGYGRARPKERDVMAAAKRAFVDEFVQPLPAKYDTMIGEHGTGLSGGQRQRIAIARAILRDPTVLIFDEATSQIDADSEHRIHQAMADFIHGRTALIVAHRFATVLSADRIVVMNEGCIVDVGTHKELLGRCKLYEHLYRTQFSDAGG
ncbi:MAG: ABC transporter ATP-binding protein, partial [Planctomycetota bacterium]